MAMKNEAHSHRLPREAVEASIPEGIQKLFGHSPGPPALGGPAWAGGGVDTMTSRGPFQPQPFCNSPLKYTNSLLNSTFPFLLQSS